MHKFPSDLSIFDPSIQKSNIQISTELPALKSSHIHVCHTTRVSTLQLVFTAKHQHCSQVS